MITEEQALQGFGKGIDCSQAVFGEFAEALGLDRELALKLAAPFGGGMWRGETCGCVVGALMAIGLKYGQGENCDPEAKGRMLALKAKFEEAFSGKYGSCICKEMLGHDLSTQEGMARVMEEGLFARVCCKAVVDACRILQEILSDEQAD